MNNNNEKTMDNEKWIDIAREYSHTSKERLSSYPVVNAISSSALTCHLKRSFFIHDVKEIFPLLCLVTMEISN